MTTFQAIIYAIVHGFSEFLPIGSHAHHILVPYIIGWQQPTGALLGALSLGSFLALIVFFRHDWASMISCLLQVIIYRKRPMTLDERLPLFLGVTTVPVIFATYYFHERIHSLQWAPTQVAALLAVTSLPLWVMDYMGRKTKGMFDWNWGDAAIVGFIQATAIVPGWDHLSGALVAALFLNYRREAAVKYAYFAATPFLLGRTLKYLEGVSFSMPAPMPDVSWLSFGIALIVSFITALLVIGGFLKQIQNKGMSQYVTYRWVLAIVVCALFWFRSRS
jgi:undecaprenyl-diphosphatase